MMELFTTTQRRVFGTLAPGKLAELFRLGDPGNHATGIATAEVLKGFYEFHRSPPQPSAEAVHKAVARGVERGLFSYATGRPLPGDDGRYLIDRSRVEFERGVADDEIDLDTGLLIPPQQFPRRHRRPSPRRPAAMRAERTRGDLETAVTPASTDC